MTIEAYINSQQLFEKRLKTLEKTHEQKFEQYVEGEKSADESVTKLESELDDTQQELQQLAEQNAKLLIENTEYRGQLAVFDSRFENTKSNQD